MSRWIAVAGAALVVVVAAGAGQSAQPSNPRARVDAMLEDGKLVDAEATARAGGAALRTALGDVLVLRGRIAAADSAYRAAVASGGPEERGARVGLA